MSIERIWRRNAALHHGQKVPWTIWDMGNETWELKGDILRHFRVLSREILQEQVSQVQILKELLQQLPESPIPLEAIGRHSVGSQWEVEEHLLFSSPPPQPQQQPVLQPQQQKPRDKAQAGVNKEYKTKEHQHRSSVEKTHHVPPKLSDLESQASDSLQGYESHPSELWSSLSQWIPPNALYQPSLHHLAMLELSDTPVHLSGPQKGYGQNSRSGLAQRPSAGQVRPSKPYHQRTSKPPVLTTGLMGQSRVGGLSQFQNSGPLFL